MRTDLLVGAAGLKKSYVIRKTRLEILKGADLSVQNGETVSIVGMSGAGKSTLLHILGGLDCPDAGSVWIQGRDLYRLPGSSRCRIRATKVGLVFQSYQLLPEMDVMENVMLPAMAIGGFMGPAGSARGRAQELLKAVGLLDRADHTPLELSGGEQQRVAVARALMNDPELVLADEPTGNLDESTGRQVLDCLFSLTRERGHALVLVTHDERVARSCDRTLRLREGILVKA